MCEGRPPLLHLASAASPPTARLGRRRRAVVPTGTHTGTHTGRIAVRATGSFNIKTAHGLIQGIGHKRFRLLQRADRYAYTTRPEGPTTPA